MKLKQILMAGALLAVLVGCGPGDAGTAANDALATATTLVPAGADVTAEALLNDPTVEALLNDPTVEALANEALATVEAAASDPGVQAALDEAFAGLNDGVTLTQGEALSLDVLSGLPDVTNYRMTVVDAPAGAEASEGQVIKEASGGNISLNPDEYNKYFTTAGDYKVRLDVTSAGNQTATHEFTVTVP